MNEFILKTEQVWRNAAEDLPPIGAVVEVLCTMTTKASLLSLDPNMWTQESTEVHTEVKLWRELDPELPVISQALPEVIPDIANEPVVSPIAPNDLGVPVITEDVTNEPTKTEGSNCADWIDPKIGESINEPA